MENRISVAGNSHTLDEDLNNVSSRPTCLILDEIDIFFDTHKNSMKNLLNFLYEKKPQTDHNSGLFHLRGEQEKPELKFKRPIIFVCEDMYIRGLRPLRAKALLIQLGKEKELVVKKLREICEKEVKQYLTFLENFS